MRQPDITDAQAAAVFLVRHTIASAAAALGVTVEHARTIKQRIKRKGVPVFEIRTPDRDLDARLDAPRCPVPACGLRGEHVCLPGTATAYMRSGLPSYGAVE